MIVLIIYMVFIKKDDNEGINNNNSEVSFDYNEIEKELTSELNNKTIYLESCDCSKVLDYDSVNKAKCSKKIISNDTISTFINKLKTANKIELISTSKACSEYTYSVFTNDTNETLLIAYVADDTSILLVGIGDTGYAFHFTGENMNELFVNLINNDNNIIFTKLEREELENEDYDFKYTTDYFTLASHMAQCDEVLDEAIDKNGNKIIIHDNDYQIRDLRIENGRLVATGYDDCTCNSEYEECNDYTKVEFIYTGISIEINKFK